MRMPETVFELAERFMDGSKHVTMNHPRINSISEQMKKDGRLKMDLIDENDYFKSILVELVADSINYCYWYGRSDVRPGNAQSSYMYELLSNAFFDYETADTNSFSTCIERFISLLSVHRFPLIEERVKHLRELIPEAEEYTLTVLDNDKNNEEVFHFLFNELVTNFPGYSSDMFLKRASLFFIQLYRRYGWYSDILKKLHIPADYQVPKLLNYFGCFYYSDALNQKILNNIHIPKWSEEECEIRSATILTAKMLCELTGWNVADVDSWFFMRRKEVTTPFHLTITTDY